MIRGAQSIKCLDKYYLIAGSGCNLYSSVGEFLIGIWKMIKTIADLLDALKRKENEFLQAQNIQHPPTIGSMYEGLTKEILNKSIPNNINLSVISGFIVNEKGKKSRQIDCMLVTNKGLQIPYSDTYECNIHDVLAVIEVKKNLYSNDLQQAHKNLVTR